MDAIFEAPITLILIALNVVISFAAFNNEGLFRSLMFHVGAIRGGGYHRVVTSAFLHVNPTHLLFNMITLLFFGPLLETQLLGPVGYVFVFVASMLAGSFWSLMENWGKANYTAVGASGAISGVLIAFCMFEPFALLLIFFIVPMPAILFAVIYIAYSAFAMGNGESRIGHEAHLGGAIGGLLSVIYLQPGVVNRMIQDVMALFG